jgi:hypothetical protein
LKNVIQKQFNNFVKKEIRRLGLWVYEKT